MGNEGSEDRQNITLPIAEVYEIMREMLESGGEFTMTVTGNSMYPFLKHLRDQAVFAPLAGRRIRRGDIVFYQRRGGQFVMHRVYRVDRAGDMTMLGDAQWTLEPGIRPEQLRAYVSRVVRKGKTVNCERGAWRFLMSMYLLRMKAPRAARFLLRLAHAPVALIRRLRAALGSFAARFPNRQAGQGDVGTDGVKIQRGGRV